VREELRRYLIISAYLYVCFGALQLYKTALLREAGIAYLPLGIAAAKALILGKFLLIGEAERVGTRLRSRTLLQRIAHRVVALTALLIVFSVIEELVVGLVHGRPMAQTIADYHRSAPEMLATVLRMVLILIPFVTATELNRALGPGTLRRLLLAPPEPPANAPSGSNAARGPAHTDRANA
jgi:hypothetical protein